MYDLWHISSFTFNVKGDDIQTRLSTHSLQIVFENITHHQRFDITVTHVH